MKRQGRALMRCICAFGMGVMVGCCFKSCKEKKCRMMSKDQGTKDQAPRHEESVQI